MLQKYMVIVCAAVAGGTSGCGKQSEIVARESVTTGGVPDQGGAPGQGNGDGDEGSPSGGAPSVERPTFSAPVPVDELNDPDAKDQDPTLTADQLQIFFFSDRGGDADIWSAKRASADAAWEPPEVVAELNSPESEQNPSISRDGLRMWYYSSREPVGVYFAARATRSDPFGAPQAVSISGGTDPEGSVIAPCVDVAELRMAVSIGAGDSRDLFEVVRASPTGTWSEAAALSGLNSPEYAESTPYLIDDGRELLFHSGRSGSGDLFWAHRASPGLPFTQIAPLSEVNGEADFESHPHLTVDRRWLYFGSTRSGNTDIYRAEALGE